MNTSLIEIRRAEAPDALALASIHNDAWRNAYQGIIPGPELDKLINRRGGKWWDGAIRQGSRISILTFGDTVAGYANYGRNRARSLISDGEIYELYLRPEFQGLGFGRRLFTAARRDLAQGEIRSLVACWTTGSALMPRTPSGSGEPSDPARLDQSWQPPRANASNRRLASASNSSVIVR